MGPLCGPVVAHSRPTINVSGREEGRSAGEQETTGKSSWRHRGRPGARTEADERQGRKTTSGEQRAQIRDAGEILHQGEYSESFKGKMSSLISKVKEGARMWFQFPFMTKIAEISPMASTGPGLEKSKQRMEEQSFDARPQSHRNGWPDLGTTGLRALPSYPCLPLTHF